MSGLIREHKPIPLYCSMARDERSTNTTPPTLVGDVAYDEGLEVAGAITPVPGGVGAMTIVCLLRNTLQAARMQQAG